LNRARRGHAGRRHRRDPATNDTTVEYDPTFSPDGLQILYQINYYDPEIWVVEAPPPPPVGATGSRR